VRACVPSSFAGEGVDLVEEDDGGSDGPRLPKHLRDDGEGDRMERRGRGGERTERRGGERTRSDESRTREATLHISGLRTVEEAT